MAPPRRNTGTGRKTSASNNTKKTTATGKQKQAQPEVQLPTTASLGVQAAREPTQQEREKKLAEQLRKRHADAAGYKEAFFRSDDQNQKLLARVTELEKLLKQQEKHTQR